MAITTHRRSKSDGNLLHLRSMEEQSRSRGPPLNDAQPRPPSPDEGAAVATSRHRPPNRPRSEVVHQWKALADREHRPDYQIPFFTFLSRANRSAIATWCYRVADCFVVDRRVVGIALSYFDRYLCCDERHRQSSESSSSSLRHDDCDRDPLSNDNDCWPTVVACLHIAIKLHSDRQNDAAVRSALTTLCRSCRLSTDRVAREELRVCDALGWYLNPPTPVMFLEIVSDVIVNELVPAKAGRDVIELSRFLLELSVYDLQLSAERASSVARAAITVAAEHLDVSRKIVNGWLSLGALDHSSDRTDRCIPKLRKSLAANCEDTRRCSSPTNVERHSV